MRIILIAGTLGKGGAEKQLVYIACALRSIGANVRVYSLTKGEFYEAVLNAAGIPVIWFGRYSSRILRLIQLSLSAIKFHPQYIQSCHTFTNLYAVIAGRLSGAIDIGAVRSNVDYELQGNVFWGRWLLKAPQWIITNSIFARDKLIHVNRTKNIITLPNVIDYKEFDKENNTVDNNSISNYDGITLVTVANLIHAKRIDRFLRIISTIQPSLINIRGFIVGDGPERKNLEDLANQLLLTNGSIHFLGSRDDIPQILSKCDIFVLTSDTEGFPNVLLEAMAARLPIITTPAGDATRIVEDGVTGYVVDFDDIEGFSNRILTLAKSPALRRKFGEAGRNCIETLYNSENLAERLTAILSKISNKADI